jgi:hypothetical protein
MATSKRVVLPDWDADSPRLHTNLGLVDAIIHDDAKKRRVPTVEDAREWHKTMMRGLDPGNPIFVGNFRGEPGLEDVGVEVAGISGTMPWDVQAELQRFESRLQAVVSGLDDLYPEPESLDDDGRNAVIELAAWAHSDWVRIHPFANGNGRTSRMWANLILLRYGMPPVLRLRPRPDAPDYGQAGKAGMQGDDKPMARLIRRLHDEAVKSAPPVRKGPAKKK